jgi:hypothetical protein
VAVRGGIAVLGWGSLLWDLDTLAPRVDGDWRLGAGPALPMEFSRISPKRRMGLVVCLDPADGEPCPTHAIRSRRRRLDEAVADLAEREHAPAHRIGWADAGGRGQSRLPAVVAAVGAWCAAAGWDGAVWTDLEPNFAERAGRPFSVAAGIGYLRTLRDDDLAEAHRYMENAPPSTTTPLRRALGLNAWWRGLSLPAARA